MSDVNPDKPFIGSCGRRVMSIAQVLSPSQGILIAEDVAVSMFQCERGAPLP
jgi:hypothetical protein